MTNRVEYTVHRKIIFFNLFFNICNMTYKPSTLCQTHLVSGLSVQFISRFVDAKLDMSMCRLYVSHRDSFWVVVVVILLAQPYDLDTNFYKKYITHCDKIMQFV